MKKAQFYIVAAFVLVVLAFAAISFSTQNTKQIQKKDSFTMLYENFESQSIDAVNNALIKQGQYETPEVIYAQMDDFGKRFIEYATTKSQGFGMIYALTYKNETRITNYLGQTAIANNQSIETGKSITILRPQNVTVEIDTGNYTFEIKKDVQINAVFRQKQEKEMKIHVI